MASGPQGFATALLPEKSDMAFEALTTSIRRLHQRLNGSTIEYELSDYHAILNEVNDLEPSTKARTDGQLRQMSETLKARVRSGQVAGSQTIEAFALVREAAWRALGMRPFDVQVLGAIAMHRGKLAEMQTGEGKTLTAVFPAYLNALSGQGVHVLTFNDYLARRDAQWMGPAYAFLGLSVAYVQEGMSMRERQQAYAADVTYLTAKEAGFDYLRDNLCYEKNNLVHRPLHFAIIDEADSILIDEARIPLVIAGAVDDYVAETHHMAIIARKLGQGVDFEYDEYARNLHLTDTGQRCVEKLLKCGNLYASKNLELLTRLNCALHAEFLLHRDVDYIIRNHRIELVDEFTGRVADKRRWPDGIQAALEAKENLDVQSRGTILNSIALQHFLQQYPRICGMTATAQPAEEELRSFYDLHIAVIPPNKPCIRIDHPDVLFGTKAEKTRALIDEIIRVHQSRRPVLVGTRSVQESAALAAALQQRGVSCQVLNAKRDEYEAKIIAQAGRLDAVTISTNMAGRGTDIRLGGSDEKEKQAVVALGGLYVIGTNKHESRRIDQQLRGRAGRQGDPGSSRFFISLEDDLFVKYRLSELLPTGISRNGRNGRIDNPIIRREIARVQRICEGQNLEIKKTLCQYSSLIEKQRAVLFDRRDDILHHHAAAGFFKAQSPETFGQYQSLLSHEELDRLCRAISVYHIDDSWSQYLAEIADIRESIHLQRIGGQEPFVEFQKLAAKIFDELLQELDRKLVRTFNSVRIEDASIDLDELGIKVPSATWTYLVNDNPFENTLGLQLIGNTGMQVTAGLLGPIVALQLLFGSRFGGIRRRIRGIRQRLFKHT